MERNTVDGRGLSANVCTGPRRDRADPWRGGTRWCAAGGGPLQEWHGCERQPGRRPRREEEEGPLLGLGGRPREEEGGEGGAGARGGGEAGGEGARQGGGQGPGEGQGGGARARAGGEGGARAAGARGAGGRAVEAGARGGGGAADRARGHGARAAPQPTADEREPAVDAVRRRGGPAAGHGGRAAL